MTNVSKMRIYIEKHGKVKCEFCESYIQTCGLKQLIDNQRSVITCNWYNKTCYINIVHDYIICCLIGLLALYVFNSNIN